MEAAVATKPESKKASPAAPVTSPRPDLASPSLSGAVAGLPLFLQVQASPLAVGQPGDRFEREADQVAAAVVGAPGQAAGAPVFRSLSRVDGGGRVQRLCAACAAGGLCPTCAASLVQAQRLPGAEPARQSTVPELAAPDAGAPLSGAVRERIEPLLGVDLGQVRVHTSPAAGAMADGLRARAFTHANHIWLGPGQSPDDLRLMAHEAAHVVQQAAAGPAGPAPPVQRDLLDDALDVGGNLVEGAVDLGREGVNAVGRGLKKGVEWVVRQASPELADLIDQGPVAFIKGVVHKAIAGWLPSLTGGINLVEVAQNLIASFGDAFALVAGVLKGDAKSCQAFGDMLGAIRDLAASVMENPAIQALKDVLGTITKVVGKVVDFVVAPLFEGLEAILGGAWQAIKSVASTVWGWIKKARDLAASAWDWVAGKLGLGGDEGGGEGGVLGWIKRTANGIWTGIKETLAPLVGPAKKVLGVLGAFTGLGQIYLLVKYGPQVVEAVQWLWAHRNDDDLARKAHEPMSNAILPRLVDAVLGFKETLRSAADWVVGILSSLSTGLLELLGGITGVPLLSLARGLVDAVSDGVRQLLDWGRSVLQAGVAWITSLAQKVWDFVAPYKEVLSSIALAIVNPPMIPLILAGWAWQLLPSCLKAPIIDFLLDIVIGALEALPDLVLFGPLWALLKPGILGFLRGLRKQTAAQKEAVSNKVAKIISGANPEFLFGFVKGFLLGVWEGITDPIKAIWMVCEGLTWVIDYLDSLSNAALGITAPGAAPAPPAADSGTRTITAVPPAPVAAAATPAGGSTAVPAPLAPAATPSGAAPTGPSLATPAPDVSGGPARPSSVDLSTYVTQQAQALQPDVGVVTGGFWDAAQEYFSGGEAMSYDTLTAKLGELWETIQRKMAEMGGELADKVTTFFTTDAEADSKLGEGVGWLAGTIVFQVVLDAITAGTWIAAGPVVKAIAKFINWPMEFMGEAFKLLGKLGGYVVDGLKSLGKVVTEAGGGALKAVTEALGGIGKKLVSIAEELLARFGGGVAHEGSQLAGQKLASVGKKELAQLGERGGTRLGGTAATDVVETNVVKTTKQEIARTGETKGVKATKKEGEQAAEKKGAEAASEATEKPAAAAAAEAIEMALQERASIPLLLATLDLALKPRFAWIKGFRTKPEGAAHMVYMIASETRLLPFRPGASLLADPKAEPAAKGTPEGDQWRYERYQAQKAKDGEKALDYEDWLSRSRGGRSGGPGHQEIQNSLARAYEDADVEVAIGDRFADAYWPKGPNGKPVYHQIGGVNPGRLDPIARERDAIQDIRKALGGQDVDIYFWDKARPGAPPVINPDLAPGWQTRL